MPMNLEDEMLRSLKKNFQKAEVSTIPLKPSSYFHLSNKDKLNYVRYRIKHMRPRFLDILNIKDFMPINFESENSFYTYGMIMSLTGEPLTQATTNGNNTVFLQNTEDGSIVPIKLNLDQLTEFSLYNGQIVAVKAKNAGNNELIVEKIVSLSAVDINLKTKMFSKIIVSTGPFTQEKLDKLISFDSEFVILFGPFIINSESNEFSSFDIFLDFLSMRVRRNKYTKVVLVPSLQDDYFMKILPQPEITLKSGLSLNDDYTKTQPEINLKSDRIIISSNPGYLYLNNNLFSLVNYDSLTELSENEFVREDYNSSKIIPFDRSTNDRLSYYLIFQGSFLPVFPSKYNVAYGQDFDMDIAPDFFITSSKISCFDTKVGPSVVLNIGDCADDYFILSTGMRDREYNIEYININ